MGLNVGILNKIVELGYRAKTLVKYVIGKIIRKLRALSHLQPFRSLYYFDEFFLLFEYFALSNFLRNHIFLRLTITTLLAGLDVFVSFYVIKPELLGLEYTGENRHIFSKHIALHDLALASIIALLVGIVPATIDYFDVPSNSLNRFLCSTLLAWLTCIIGIQRGMLVHARNVWIANRSRTKVYVSKKRKLKH